MNNKPQDEMIQQQKVIFGQTTKQEQFKSGKLLAKKKVSSPFPH